MEHIGWGMGFGGMGLLYWLILILLVAALVKFLLGGGS